MTAINASLVTQSARRWVTEVQKEAGNFLAAAIVRFAAGRNAEDVLAASRPPSRIESSEPLR
jgi:hypothetical protein